MEIRYGRKRSGIKKAIKNKLDDWVEHIDDDDVKAVVKRHAIVTGGSIASMLLGEKVNDFDVYLRTKEAAAKVAEYYCSRFNKSNERRVKEGVHPYTPEVRVESDRVRIFIKSAGVAAEDAGEYSYFESLPPEAAAEFVESTVQERGDASDEKPRYRPVFLSENAITLSDSVQVVVRFFGDVGEIHRNYDFVHATCSYDYHTGELTLPPAALECLLSRTLIYQGSLYPVASIFRMKKFLERGWRITAGQQLKIMLQISELNMTYTNNPGLTPEQNQKQHALVLTTLREQLTGVDMAYLYEVIQAIKDTDPEKISTTYISEIIDRIFDG